MQGAQVIVTAFGGAHNWFQGTVQNLTQEQANYLPPGVAHSIGKGIIGAKGYPF